MDDAPSTERAERVGEGIGRTYARTTATLVAPIRRAPAPTWPRERVLVRTTAVRRRVKNIPRRLLNGLRTLLTRKRTNGKKSPDDGATGKAKPKGQKSKVQLKHYLGGAFVTWWAGTWAAQESVLPWVLTAAAIIGAGAAYAVGDEPETPSPHKSKTAPDTAPEKSPEEISQPPGTDPLIALCWHLIGTNSGVHLRALVTALQQKGTSTSPDAAQVRAALEQRGVPTRASLKVAGKVTRGVHRDDLEAATNHFPDEVAQERPGTATTEVATASDLQ